MIRNMVIWFAALALILSGVFGVDRVLGHLAAVRGRAVQAVEAQGSVDHDVERAKYVIGQKRKEIVELEIKIARAQDDYKKLEDVISSLEEKLTQQEAVLRKIRALIDQGKSEYRIGHAMFTREEVNADALERIESLSGMKEESAYYRQLQQEMAKCIEQGSGDLRQCHRDLGKRESELYRLVSQNNNAETRMAMAEIVSSVADISPPDNSALDDIYSGIKDKIQRKNRTANARIGGTSRTGRIDYGPILSPADASQEIDRYFGKDVDEAGPYSAGSLDESPPVPLDAADSE